jgi:hypothetical protein
MAVRLDEEHKEFVERLAELQRVQAARGGQKGRIAALCKSTGYVPVDAAFARYDFLHPSGMHMAAPSELLHLLYLGLVKDVVLLTVASVRAMVESDASSVRRLGILGDRLRQMPRFRCRNSKTRRFGTGVVGVDFDKLTGEDFLHLLSQLPFVLGDQGAVVPLLKEDGVTIPDPKANMYTAEMEDCSPGDKEPKRDPTGASISQCLLAVLTIVHKLVTCHMWADSDLNALESDLVRMNNLRRYAFAKLDTILFRKPKVCDTIICVSPLEHLLLLQTHMLVHLVEWIREFGALLFISSSSYETNHIYDVKDGVEHIDGSSRVPEQLLEAAKLFRAATTAAAIGVRRSSQGGRTSDCATTTASTSSADRVTHASEESGSGDSSGEDRPDAEYTRFRLRPKAGLAFDKAKHDVDLLPSTTSFLVNTGVYIAHECGEFPHPEDQPASFPSARARRAWLAHHAVQLRLTDIRFYRSLYASSKGRMKHREYAFSIVASKSYRGKRRQDCVFVRSGDDADPFIARVLAWFSVVHDGTRYNLAYVMYFEDAPESNARRRRPAGAFQLPFRRLQIQKNDPYDCVDLSSLIKPAHVVPNFDTPVTPRPAGDNMTVLYKEFRLCEQHFPMAL